ncbi:MAG TPA: DUF4034 domain-containing protein, partial [Burkholderiales bacterium]|nr:DUF4034 domain-containing protein [Burkholderiales bacterium]
MVRIAIACLFCLLTAITQSTAAAAALEREEILQALKEGRFSDLESRLNELQIDFETDTTQDRPLMEAVWEIANLSGTPEIDAAFDRWIEQAPQSYVARLARGAYYVGRGLDARGTKWSSETSARQFEEMRRHFKTARADLEASLPLSAKPMASYYELIVMAMRSGKDKEIEAHYRSTIAFVPRAIEMRVLYLDNLQPRWGGSFKEMEAYVEKSAKILGEGKDLNRLRALVVAERAHVAREADNYPEAQTRYGEAIALHDHSYYRCMRAGISAHMKRFDSAAEDLDMALFMAKTSDTCGDQI